MNKTWQDKLTEYCTLLYPNGMSFEVPDHWGPILVELSLQLNWAIAGYIWKNPECLDGDEFDDRIPHAVQVKEKFGGLRFYMSFQTERMDELIRQAEEKVWALEEEMKNEQKKSNS